MTEFVQRTVAKFALPVALICCLALSSLVFLHYVAADKFANDFGVYWRAANQPLGEVYLWRGRFPFPYAPTMLLWIQPLAFIAKWPAYFLFIGGSAVAFILAFRPYLSKLALALAMISPPFMRGIFTGQVCAALSALLVWACATPNRIAAGLGFAVIASIKPQLVIMAPLMLALNKDWRAFVSAGVSFLGIVLVSLILFGPARWVEWVASMGHFHSAVSETNVLGVGVTPAMMAERWGLNPIPFMLLGTLAGALTVWLCRDAGPIEKATAIAIGSLMAAPYALVYDLSVVVPFLALLTFQGRVWAALGIATNLHPLPLVITAYELLRERVTLTRRMGHATI